MNGKYKEGDLWTDAGVFWPEDAPGPDPRVRAFKFVVSSWDYLDDVKDPFGETVDKMWDKEYKTAQAAINAYHNRLKRKETQRCDIQMNLKYGSIFQQVVSTPIPRLSPMFSGTVYIYLARWRADGAFVETYHTNERKFSERNHKRRTDELDRTCDTPGLMEHYVKKKKLKQ
jgi:hypothetical protein